MGAARGGGMGRVQTMQEAPVRKEFDIRAPTAPQLELRLHWFGRALQARRGYIVRVERSRRGAEHVASIAYEMPLPRYEGALRNARRTRRHGAEPQASVSDARQEVASQGLQG